ncbi:MAG: glycosyltransferase family 1 protein [Halieaceae bacterium]
MRIAVDARQLVPPLTGIGRYTENLLRLLVNSGDQWFLYSDRQLSPAGLPWLDSPAVTLRHGAARGRGLASLWHANVDFVRWARRDDIDVFWSPRHHLPFFLPRQLAGVVTIHDLVWRRYPESMPLANRWLERAAMGFSIRRARRVIAVSEFTAGEIAHFYPGCASPVQVVHEAARLLEAGTAVPLDPPYFLFVGTLEPRKNLALLLEAFAAFVAATDCPHRLVIIGAKGWGLPDLLAQARTLGIEQRVSVPGFVSDAELAGYYQAAAALVMPSLYEGFGLPLVEAMQYGVPLIVADRAALPEIAGDGALLVDPESVDQIQAALARVATDDNVRGQLSRQSRQRGTDFSWHDAARATLAILQHVGADS